MYRIVKKEALKPTVTLYEIEAPMVAKKAEPGQFIILRVDENGERIPITIHDFDREKGTVTIIVQIDRRHHRKAQTLKPRASTFRTLSARWAARPRPKARRRSASWAAASAAPSLTPF